MTAHAKRRARTKRRMAAIGSIVWAVGAGLKLAAETADENLSSEELLKRLAAVPLPPGALTPAELNAELETVRVGQRRSKGRPAKPQNTNDGVIALLREHRASDFRGRFTLARANETKAWLYARGIHKSTDAVAKLISREKKRRRQ